MSTKGRALDARQLEQEQPKPASISNMSSLFKIINARRLEADLLVESPSRDEVDWASDQGCSETDWKQNIQFAN